MLKHIRYFSLLTLLLFACSKGNDGSRCNLDGDCDSSNPPLQGGGADTLPDIANAISCTATSTKSIFAHNDEVFIKLTASGGSGIFSVPGTSIASFSGSTTVSIGKYLNYGSTDRAVEKSIWIADSAKHVTSCNFRFTVSPSTGASGLSCGITLSKYNPMVGEAVTATIKATGGKAPYTFGQFYPRQGETPKNLTTVSGGDASVSHAYGWVGFVDPAVKVTDANGSSVWCEIPNRYTQVLPITPPKLTANQNPGNVDADGNATDPKDLVLVTLSASGFSGTSPLEYSYSSAEAGVSIKQNLSWLGSNVFFVKRLDTVNHNFNIVFTAKTADNSQSANVTVNVKLGGSLNCYVDEPLYLFQGVEGLFTVNSYTGDALEIAEVVNTSDVTVRKVTNGNAAVLGLTFASQGFYELRFKTRSRIDALKYCNGGNDYAVGAYILPSPSSLTGCEVKPSLTSVNVDSPLRIDIARKGGSVDINGYFVTLTPNGASTLIAGPYVNGPDTASVDLKLNDIKTYTLTATMKELSTGKTVSCQAQVESVSRPGLLARVFQIPKHTKNALNLYPNFNVLPINQGDSVVSNINVSARRSDCRDHHYHHLKKYGFSSECQYPGVYGRTEWFAIEYTGYIKAPVSGTYNFKFEVDDSVALEIDGANVIFFDGFHAPQSTPTNSLYLSAGDHTIKIRYVQGPKWEVANIFYWQKPGGIWEVVPAGVFRQP